MDLFDIAIARKLAGGSGGGGGGSSDYFIAELDLETYALNKTWQEVHDALESLGVGKVLIIYSVTDRTTEMVTTAFGNPHDGYEIHAYAGAQNDIYLCENADDYPILD